MKTTFLPAAAVLLVTMLTPAPTQASSPPDLDAEGEVLETSPAATLASADLQPGAAVVAGRNVNIRSKATIQSEVITQMQDGDEVFIEEIIVRPDAVGKDPNRWAQIAYPAKAAAWVHSLYVEADSGTVKPRKLNVRSGPGENHAVVGALRAGDTVTIIGTEGDWLEIKPPDGTTAYVAAKLLRQEAPVIAEETEVEEVETVETAMVESQPEVATGDEASEPEVVAADVESTTVVETGGATQVTETVDASGATDLEPLPEVAPSLEMVPEEPLPPRVVQREGIVRAFTSIQAPSYYKLVSVDNGRTINYLYSSTDLDLGRYVGLHIMATGEESLDRRWPNTPVLTLERIVLVE